VVQRADPRAWSCRWLWRFWRRSSASSREEVEEILKGLGEQLSEPVAFLVIGGAAMLEYGLKDVTKDIDLVCRDAAGQGQAA